MRLVVLICCFAALVAAGGSLLLAGRYETALIAAVAMLVCAQVVSLLANSKPKEIEDARLASLSEGIKRNARNIEQLTTRSRDQAQLLAELKQEMSKRHQVPALPKPSRPVSPPLTAPEGHSPERSGPDSRAHAGPRPLVRGGAGPNSVQSGPPPETQPVGPGIYLEPVVRLAEGRTAYYKASLQQPSALPGGGLLALISADLNLGARQAPGWTAARDLQLIREIMPVLTKLRARRGATGLFVPLSIATLESGPDLEQVVRLLQENPDAAAGIVLDLNVSALAVMPEAAMRGLAWLASLGATFCLSGASASNNDLAALAELGFAFLDVPEHELVDASGQLLPAAVRLREMAASHQFTLLASGIGQGRHAASLMQAVSLARGPAFALPRALKPQGAGTAGALFDQRVA